MRCAAGAWHRLVLVSVEKVFVRCPKSLALADLDGGDRHVKSVDEVRFEVLADGCDSASDPYVLSVGCIFGLSQRFFGCRFEEVERGVGEREAGSVMVGEYEHGGMERWRVAPPSGPVVILPRAALGSELVAPHDLSADVPCEVAHEVVVESSGSTGLGSVRPTRGGERPRSQIGWEIGDATTSGFSMSEGRFEALAFTCPEPVHRHHEVLYPYEL